MKNHLRDLHQEIDLLDRKIAHFQGYERFESEHERTGAVGKLLSTRDGFVKVALEFAEKDIEYSPRSFKSVGVPLSPGADVASAELLVKQIQVSNPRQLVVGSPLYVASSVDASPARFRRPQLKVDQSAQSNGPRAVDRIDFAQRVRDAEAETNETPAALRSKNRAFG
jgi:hypothetical protein